MRICHHTVPTDIGLNNKWSKGLKVCCPEKLYLLSNSHRRFTRAPNGLVWSKLCTDTTQRGVRRPGLTLKTTQDKSTEQALQPAGHLQKYQVLRSVQTFREFGPFFNSFMISMSDEKIGHKINHVPPVDASPLWLMMTLLLALEWKAKDLQYLKSQENSCKTDASSHSACKLFIYTLWREHQLELKHTAATSETSDKHHLFFSLSGLFVTTLEALKCWALWQQKVI